MKKICMLFLSMFPMAVSLSQVQELPHDTISYNNADKTLKAATTMCVISFVYQATGAVMILSGYEKMNQNMGVGLAVAIGGVGMATNNAILTNSAYHQIQQLRFAQEDSLLRMRMLRNIKSARVLSIIQNITPIIGVAAGAINWVIANPDKHGELYTSALFWVPTISICAVGLALTIPEIILISKTRRDLNRCRQKITFGTTNNGLGLRYTF